MKKLNLLAIVIILHYGTIIASTPSFSSLYSSSDNIQICVGESFAETTETTNGSITTGYLTGEIIIAESSTTELANIDETYLIYPNPTKDILKILGKGDISGTNILIFSSSGSMVINQPLTQDIENQLNLSALSAGIYHLIITNNSSEVIFKSKLIKSE